MKETRRLLNTGCGLLLAVGLCLGIGAAAQDNPSRQTTQPVVLADLAARVGRGSLSLADLGDWNWFFGTYSYVISFGCTGAPTSDPAGGRWQRWELTYSGTAYNYLITDNAQTLILCDAAALTTPTAPPPATAAPVTPLAAPAATSTPGATGGSITLTESPDCPLPPRLVVGAGGRVTPGEPNWVHSEPSRSSQKFSELAGESTFIVSQGPVCDAASGMNYWLIQTDIGQSLVWTSEGRDGEYWLEPFSVRQSVGPTTAARLRPAAWVQTFPVPIQDVIFSPSAAYFVVLDEVGRAALYEADTQNLVRELRSPGSAQPYTQIVFSPDEVLLATVTNGNSVFIWDVAAVRPVGQITVETAITTAAFNPLLPPNHVIAIATDGEVRLWPAPLVTPQTPPLVTLPVEGVVSELAFSTDGQRLIARDAAEKMLALWEVGE